MSQVGNQASTAEAQELAEAGVEAEAEMVAEDAAQQDAPGETPEAQAEAIRVGRVVAVSGSQVITLLENVLHDGDDPDAPKLQIGTLIKTETPASTVFGMVSGLSIPIPKQDAGNTELNIIEMELVGETMKDPGEAEQPSSVAFPFFRRWATASMWRAR